MNGQEQSESVEHRQLADRLQQQRHRIEEALPPAPPPTVRLSKEFPRSQTMRLILTEPALLAVLSALLMPLLNRRVPRLMRLVRLVPLAMAAMRLGHAVGRGSHAHGGALEGKPK
jgi:hypothetical protein